MTEAERKARVQLAACYRVFDMLGWTEMIFNHITLRVPGPERVFLINPFGLQYREVTASNLVLVDIDGNPVREPRWPVNRAGFVIHSAIHGAIRRRALRDAHPHHHRHGGGLPEGRPVARQLLRRAAARPASRTTSSRASPSTRTSASAWCASIGDKQAVILRNHGLLAWGADVPEAFMWLWTLQRACDVQIAASAAGALNPIRARGVRADRARVGPGEKRTCDDVFAAHAAPGRCAGSVVPQLATEIDVYVNVN